MQNRSLLSIGAVAGALAALCALWPCPPASAGDERTIRHRLPTGNASAVRVEVPVGEVWVEGTDGGELVVAVDLRCEEGRRRCPEAAQRVRLDSLSEGGELRLAIADWPRHGDQGLELELVLQLPRSLALALQVGVGEVHVDGLTNQLALELGVGEAELHLPESAVGEVHVSVGVGEASLTVHQHEIEGNGFLGRNIDWKGGTGGARVSVDCGVGEVAVKLD